ncbi:MAG TPA: RNA polymerase sigma factor [Candidatus Paceibacterota bacterium]
MELSDTALVEKILLKDSQALNILIERYTVPLYNFIYRISNDAALAEDATQETFIKMWQRFTQYNSAQSFRAWLFTIARNTATDHLRKKKSFTFSQLSSNDQDFESSLPSDHTSVVDILDQQFDSVFLENHLNNLPINYKSVLILHYQQELTFQEISDVLETPMNTVKSWHHRALSKLKQELNQ